MLDEQSDGFPVGMIVLAGMSDAWGNKTWHLVRIEEPASRQEVSVHNISDNSVAYVESQYGHAITVLEDTERAPAGTYCFCPLNNLKPCS